MTGLPVAESFAASNFCHDTSAPLRVGMANAAPKSSSSVAQAMRITRPRAPRLRKRYAAPMSRLAATPQRKAVSPMSGRRK